MTIQTRHFIEVSDLLALRFVCKKCDATLSLLLSDDKLKTGENRVKNFIDRCPSCGCDWFDIGQSSYEQVITRVTASLNRLIELMNSETAKSLGASLIFEIKPGAVPGERT